MPISDYEKQREENIRRNKELLRSLGLEGPLFEPKNQPRKKATNTKKRKSEVPAEEDTERPAKVQKEVGETNGSSDGPRRSSRNAGKTIDYGGEIELAKNLPFAYSSGVKTSENEGPLGREDGPRRHDPKTYGSIPGIEVGTWWETRQGCSADAIHAPWVGGISGGKNGAHSVALSGGYADDVDVGYAFTYTGSGGRDLKGTKAKPKNLRTGPQSSDQSFDNTFNRMLQKSCQTKKPIRVIRGFKSKSKYAPSEGYRYDGLYVVEKAWLEKGLNPKGFLVCKFAFKRLPGQPALPVRDLEEDTSRCDSQGVAEDDNPQEGGSDDGL